MRELNRMLDGWANYFCLGPVSQAYRARGSATLGSRLRQWLCAEAQGAGPGNSRVSRTSTCTTSLGLVRLTHADAQLPVGERVSPCPRAGCGKSARPVR